MGAAKIVLSHLSFAMRLHSLLSDMDLATIIHRFITLGVRQLQCVLH